MKLFSKTWTSASLTLSVLFLCSSACGASFQQGWGHISSSLERIALPSLGAEVIFYDVENLARRGSDRVVAIILDANIAIEPVHFSQVGLENPAVIDTWSNSLNDILLLNAGLFDEDGSPLGLAKARDAYLSEKKHSTWQGFIVGDAPSHIADLRFDSNFEPTTSKNIWQSMMLLDRTGSLRVRKTTRSACRSVLGEDDSGHVVIVLTEGAVTLADLATWLRDGPLKMVQALNLDGGHESQLLLRTPELELNLVGQHGVHLSGGPRRPIPAVLAFRRAAPNT